MYALASETIERWFYRNALQHYMLWEVIIIILLLPEYIYTCIRYGLYYIYIYMYVCVKWIILIYNSKFMIGYNVCSILIKNIYLFNLWCYTSLQKSTLLAQKGRRGVDFKHSTLDYSHRNIEERIVCFTHTQKHTGVHCAQKHTGAHCVCLLVNLLKL